MADPLPLDTDSSTVTGTWLPNFSFAVPGTMASSPTDQEGYYIKVGKVVFASFYVDSFVTKGTASGNMRVVGLPFPAVASPGGGVFTWAGKGFISTIAGITWPTNATQLVTDNGGNGLSYFGVVSLGPAGNGQLQASSFPESGFCRIAGMFIYTVD